MRACLALLTLLTSVLGSGETLTQPRELNAQSLVDREVVGSLVTVSLQVDGESATLFPAADGSGRYYLEAREGSEYAVTVANRSDERVGVAVVVDGLNAISGERQNTSTLWRRAGPGRLYVLDPWGSVSVQGWRTSLEDVRRFTFVNERTSYAARSGKANARMGWIEVLVYREKGRQSLSESRANDRVGRSRDEAAKEGAQEEGSDSRPAPAGGEARAPAPSAQREDASEPEYGGRSFPGTGWGAETEDPVVLVDFEAEQRPTERIELRYEYLDALIRLGVAPHIRYHAGRLSERDRGEQGFAAPPPRQVER
ncbi:MAG: hypothetical protein H0V09_04195 [Gemmatimonadetes bacterium]|nr:hypothetical protein [Gemmatimonadota bacterium]